MKVIRWLATATLLLTLSLPAWGGGRLPKVQVIPREDVPVMITVTALYPSPDPTNLTVPIEVKNTGSQPITGGAIHLEGVDGNGDPLAGGLEALAFEWKGAQALAPGRTQALTAKIPREAARVDVAVDHVVQADGTVIGGPVATCFGRR